MLLKPLGVEVLVNDTDEEHYGYLQRRGDFDVARAGWIADYYDPQNFLCLNESERSINYSKCSNPEFDDMMRAAAETTRSSPSARSCWPRPRRSSSRTCRPSRSCSIPRATLVSRQGQGLGGQRARRAPTRSLAQPVSGRRRARRLGSAVHRPGEGPMLLYVLRRLATAIPTLFVIVTISFFLIRVAPGGPFNQERAARSRRSRPTSSGLPPRRAALEAIPHLSRQPRCTAISARATPAATSPSPNCSRSACRSRSSSALGARRSRWSSAALLGVIAALRQNRGVDYAVIAMATVGSTIPTFVIAPLLQLVFGVGARLAAGRRLGRRRLRNNDRARSSPSPCRRSPSSRG